MNIYYISLNDAKKLNEEQFSRLFPKRYIRAQKFVKEEDRLRSIAAAYLIYKIIGVDESEVLIKSNDKPFLKISDLYFNLSHSGDYAVLAVSEREVGVDIELINSDNLFIASKVYTEDELAWMNEFNECTGELYEFCNPEYRFHVLWTVKESLLKAIGDGLMTDPKEFSVMRFISDGSAELFGRTWFCKTAYLDGHVISLCSLKQVNVINSVQCTV